MEFKLESTYKPTGDQPRAIEKLTAGVKGELPNQVLLGVTGSGKSLAFDEPIFVIEENKEGSAAKILPIGELIDKLLKKFKSIKTGNTEIFLPGKAGMKYKAFSLNTISGNCEIKKINKFIRHSVNSDNFYLRTVCGREIEVTGDHNFWVLRNGHFKLIKTTEVAIEDYIPIPLTLSLPNDNKDLEGVWVTDWINRTSYFDVKDIPKSALKNKKSLKKILGREKLWRVINKGEKVNTEWLFKIIKNSREIKALMVNRRIGKKINLFQKLSDDFLKFVGFYLAEGHGEKNYLLFSVYEKEFKKIFTNCLENMCLKYKERNLNPGDFQLSNSILTEVIVGWCGNKANAKVFPPWFMELSKRQLGIILSVYFSGDGNVTLNEVSATSASRNLISGLSYSLLRFGIKVRIRRKMKRATNSSMEKKEYFEAVISGQEDLRNFAVNIGFILTRKQKKLERIINKKANTNVDIVPIDGTILQIIRFNLHLSQNDLAEGVGCDRSYLSMIENRKRYPSRKVLKKIINFIKQQPKNKAVFKEISLLEALTKIFWTKIREIKQIKPTSTYVYDVAVEKNETFLAGHGGFFVHNTFSIANVIQNVQKPTLVISHNKTLAAQLYQEFKQYFPNNAVSYFVSYYDYYQPEAYIPQTDTYIAKDADINEEIDKLRLLATSHIFSRKDVIVIASVSCIYNLGSPDSYGNRILPIFKGQKIKKEDLMSNMVSLYYLRSRLDFDRGNFRLRGETVEIYPSYSDEIIKIGWENDVIANISTRPIIEGKEVELENYFLYPAKHFLADKKVMDQAFKQIKEDLKMRLAILKKEGKELEANRLNQRVNYDLEMIKEVGYVNGIENYSRYFDNRSPGDPPFSLLDYFKNQYNDDYLVVVDESHMTVPQVRGMYHGDSSRKKTLVDFGFRLPSCLDNRPLNFKEFLERVPQAIFVSATPDDWEIQKSENHVAEQLLRPTGLVDPQIEVRPIKGQINNLIDEILVRKKKGERVLITTLTKRMAEDLSTYLADINNTKETISVHYLHADVDTLQRTDILADLRKGIYDVIVGINLLREGLDLPEVSLVAILDADKQGFLRSRVSLIQTMGRTARNVSGKVILYADEETLAMKQAIEEVERRRKIQLKYNEEHGIIPKSIQKPIRESLIVKEEEEELSDEGLTPADARKQVAKLNKKMKEYAKLFEFEKAAKTRDRIIHLKKEFNLI